MSHREFLKHTYGCLLTIDSRDIHDKSGIFMGSWDEMEKVKKFHK